MFSQRKKRADRRRYKLRKRNLSGLLRLTVFRSINNIYAQLIDDSKSMTLMSSSSLDKDLKDVIKGMNKVSIAVEVGKLIGSNAIKSGIKKVIFDCGSYKYHGRVSAVAKGACESGLII